MSEQDFDQAKAEAFGEKMTGILNGGALALMTSLGHRTGLFDAMARIPPGDSSAIAKASALVAAFSEYYGGPGMALFPWVGMGTGLAILCRVSFDVRLDSGE